MSTMDSTILKSLSLVQVLEQWPESSTIFEEFGLAQYAKTETARHENIEASVLVHNISLDDLLKALGAVIK
jgi:hypothetical protein